MADDVFLELTQIFLQLAVLSFIGLWASFKIILRDKYDMGLKDIAILSAAAPLAYILSGIVLLLLFPMLAELGLIDLILSAVIAFIVVYELLTRSGMETKDALVMGGIYAALLVVAHMTMLMAARTGG